MHTGKLPPKSLLALSVPEQKEVLAEAQDVLALIARSPGAEDIKRIDKVIQKATPRIPGVLSVLKHRKILEILPLPRPNSGVAVSAAATSDLIKVGTRVLGPTNRAIKDARVHAIKRSQITDIEAGAGVLASRSTGIREPAARASARRNFEAVQEKARPERERVERSAQKNERALEEKIWERISRFDKGAKTSFIGLDPSPMKSALSAKIINFYQDLGSFKSRYTFSRTHPHFRAMLKHACSAMTWTHDVFHDMEAVINEGGTIRERVRDVLIHAVSLDWSGTKSFEAGGKTWQVHYHKHKAEDSRVFTAETVDASGKLERVILWYGTGGDLPHATAGYDSKISIAIAAFRTQLGA